jgi:hypothetical protein
MTEHRQTIVWDDDGAKYPIVILADGTRIDAALFHLGEEGIAIGRKHPVPDHHREVKPDFERR